MGTFRIAAIGALCCAAQRANSQSAIPIRTLPPANARSTEIITNIVDLKHLPDGRVLVNVPDQKRLILIDSSLTKFTVLADSLGSGPNRYPPVFVPLIPFTGDSTLFADYESKTFTVIDPTGKPGRVAAPPKEQDFLRIARRTVGGVTGTDAAGRLVYQVTPSRPLVPAAPAGPGRGGSASTNVGTAGSFSAPDSQVIVRADFATRAVDTMAKVRPPFGEYSLTNPVARDGRVTTAKHLVNPALPASDDWAVLADGSIAIVRGGDYHIDWIYADGTRATTAKMPFDWRRLTDEDKQRKLDSAKKIIDSLASAGVDPYMMVMRSSVRTDTIHPTIVYASLNEIADYVAPIRQASVKGDADGNLWILPTTSSQATGGLLYDVVNGKGALFQRVRIPADRVIVGFGKGGVVYMAVLTAPNRWVLERSRLAPIR